MGFMKFDKFNNYNYSIGLLKIFFSFVVVTCHYWLSSRGGNRLVYQILLKKALVQSDPLLYQFSL